MARSIRSPALETRSARLRLPVARKPVFVKIGDGLHLGYRRNRTAGAWVARVIAGGDWTKSIGIADDHEEANGANILDYWQAQAKARETARGSEKPARPITVGEALDAYEADLQIRGADTRNVARARIHLSADLAATAVIDLVARRLRAWRDGLIKEVRRPRSIARQPW